VGGVLGLGDEAWLNTPGTRHGNWSWRLSDGQLTAGHAAWLRGATEAAGRLSGPSSVSPPGRAGSSGA
jgi:4-alpha-glucanotransferase